MTVDAGYIIVQKFAGVTSWYKMNTKGFISTKNFKIRNENNELVSFNFPIINQRSLTRNGYIQSYRVF